MTTHEIRNASHRGRFEHLRLAAFHANMQLPQLGLVLFTFGNASAADQVEGVFAIKPSGVPYNELTPDMMVVVDFDPYPALVTSGNGQAVLVWSDSDALCHAALFMADKLMADGLEVVLAERLASARQVASC